MSAPVAEPRGTWFWGCVLVGWGAIAFGLRGLVHEGEPLVGFGRWFVGLAVLHDALVAPLTYGVAWLAGRVLPRRAVVPVRAGLAASALIVVFAWPLARGYGRAASNPSALPLDYTRNLVVVLGAIWLVVAAWIATTAVHDRRAADAKGAALPDGH